MFQIFLYLSFFFCPSPPSLEALNSLTGSSDLLFPFSLAAILASSESQNLDCIFLAKN
jgi:hypothetical protein